MKRTTTTIDQVQNLKDDTYLLRYVKPGTIMIGPGVTLSILGSKYYKLVGLVSPVVKPEPSVAPLVKSIRVSLGINKLLACCSNSKYLRTYMYFMQDPLHGLISNWDSMIMYGQENIKVNLPTQLLEEGVLPKLKLNASKHIMALWNIFDIHYAMGTLQSYLKAGENVDFEVIRKLVHMYCTCPTGKLIPSSGEADTNYYDLIDWKQILQDTALMYGWN